MKVIRIIGSYFAYVSNGTEINGIYKRVNGLRDLDRPQIEHNEYREISSPKIQPVRMR